MCALVAAAGAGLWEGCGTTPAAEPRREEDGHGDTKVTGASSVGARSSGLGDVVVTVSMVTETEEAAEPRRCSRREAILRRRAGEVLVVGRGARGLRKEGRE